MMTPFLSVTGGGDQEKTTSLSPATAVTPTGEPDGTEREIVFSNNHRGLTLNQPRTHLCVCGLHKIIPC